LYLTPTTIISPASLQQLHPTPDYSTYADVVLPLAVMKPYTYAVPAELAGKLQAGMRVEVQFAGNKLYAGLVLRVHQDTPSHRTKEVLSLIDEAPLLNEKTIEYWRWLAAYYCCTLGEVMEAALPAGLKLASEKKLVLHPDYTGDVSGLSDKEYMVVEALGLRGTITVDDVRKILNQKAVIHIIKRLFDRQILDVHEEMEEKFKPRKVACVRLAAAYRDQPELLSSAFDLCARAQRQTEALLGFIQLNRRERKADEGVLRAELYQAAGVDAAVLSAMAKKGIFELYEREVSRLGGYEEALSEMQELSEQQVRALAGIKLHFAEEKVVLLHGVTGSGKTRIYIELIQEALDRGEQVLYLLPEVALTTQIISRLQQVFGQRIGVYHHRIENNARVERWLSAGPGGGMRQEGERSNFCVLGARSALFLPFERLGLVIVDEEHDSSYKQSEPAPRYHGRDAAIYLAHLHSARVLLGTATPSIESYQNACIGKYGLVEMPDRFGGLQLPEMAVVDVAEEAKRKTMQSHFTSRLLDELKATLARGEQAILFKNRRGYAPALRCASCGWHAECVHCDVSLTYHKFRNCLVCHYCGYQADVAKTCPACGNADMKLQGFGTEKIEDELKIFLPEARIGRMDYDSVRSKDAHARIINDFEEKRVDVLVGTQMVTKGLDFENVGLVGVVSADQLLHYPDFRAAERSFQLMVQVAGRAGRKGKRGTVIVQAVDVAHPVLKEVTNHDFRAFFDREIAERRTFGYPPFSRLIRITLKHKKPDILNRGCQVFAGVLKDRLGERVMGPSIPTVGRVREQFLLDLLIKMEMDPRVWLIAKQQILRATEEMQHEKGFSNIRVVVDVDPV
jgi:primosomal protein N' (replication factor Y)